jgi:hypothetical protein
LTEPDRGRLTTPEAAADDSRGSAVRPRRSEAGIAGRIRASGPHAWLVLALGLASAVLLFVTELTRLSYRTIGIGACDSRVQNPGVCTTDGGDAHHHIFWLLAAAVLFFAFGAAVGGSRPAGAALAACGTAVLIVAVAIDLPKLDDLRGLDATYTEVAAHTGTGFWLELVGGALAVVAGVLGMRRRRNGPSEHG